ncbi:hypothetical protein NE237_016970 [Protea cynaroides]|uniref:Uncharacterized protein n=1 Tax=Protea cynaroides TaxID=273540 RepID=A0A9Q0K754_9MAGN|nr:hypothetical protein NE237_016970 [Protea cynaroides]
MEKEKRKLLDFSPFYSEDWVCFLCKFFFHERSQYSRKRKNCGANVAKKKETKGARSGGWDPSCSAESPSLARVVGFSSSTRARCSYTGWLQLRFGDNPSSIPCLKHPKSIAAIGLQLRFGDNPSSIPCLEHPKSICSSLQLDCGCPMIVEKENRLPTTLPIKFSLEDIEAWINELFEGGSGVRLIGVQIS